MLQITQWLCSDLNLRLVSPQALLLPLFKHGHLCFPLQTALVLGAEHVLWLQRFGGCPGGQCPPSSVSLLSPDGPLNGLVTESRPTHPPYPGPSHPESLLTSCVCGMEKGILGLLR